MTTTASRPAAAGGSISELLALLKDSDTCELKVTIPESEQRSAIRALGMDALDAEIRQVYFFDTPDLRLNANGVVLRARRMQRGRRGDSIVKLRPVEPATLSRELRRTEGFGVEVDAMPGGYVCSARLRRMLTAGPVWDAVGGKRPLRKLFSKEQRAFLDANNDTGVGFDDLRVLGPIFVLKLKFSPAGLDRKLVAEVWLFPDASRILELSTKCAPSEAFQVAAETRAFIEDRGLDLSSEQQTKTRHALEVLSG